MIVSVLSCPMSDKPTYTLVPVAIVSAVDSRPSVAPVPSMMAVADGDVGSFANFGSNSWQEVEWTLEAEVQVYLVRVRSMGFDGLSAEMTLSGSVYPLSVSGGWVSIEPSGALASSFKIFTGTGNRSRIHEVEVFTRVEAA